MSCSPLEFQESLEVGQVDFVSPDEIKIQLNIENKKDKTLKKISDFITFYLISFNTILIKF